MSYDAGRCITLAAIASIFMYYLQPLFVPGEPSSGFQVMGLKHWIDGEKCPLVAASLRVACGLSIY